MKYKVLSIALPLVLSSAAAQAQTRAPSPDVTFLMPGDMYASGQSNNIGPVMNQILDTQWVEGVCPDQEDFDPSIYDENDYSNCDDLRFGMSVFPDMAPAPDDDQCDPDGKLNVLVKAQEDGGKGVEDWTKEIHTKGDEEWCDNEEFRPHDEGVRRHRVKTFPDGADADDIVLDQYWLRPRLTMMFVSGLPQTADGTEDRVIDTLTQVCESYEGAGGILPSMPTWAMTVRRPESEAALYGGLLAAAGGTGECCYGSSTCDIIADAVDMCDHILGRSEEEIRNDIADGKYNCGPGSKTHMVGNMAFGEKPSGKGTKPEIACHLIGDESSANCNSNGRQATDILGIFSCVRQLPRGISADDANFVYCTSSDPDSCGPLDEAGGTIEWIDENKTLFLVKGVSCEAGNIIVNECEPNVPCEVDGATGRCRLGLTDCSTGTEVCVSELEPMPEICNGLDDDCDGDVDNMVKSWNTPAFSGYSLPSQYAGLDCNVQDVCVCPDGDTDFHAGETFASYLAEWDPVCQCGEGLAPAESTPAPQSETEADPQAACSAVTDREGAVGASFLAMLLGGVFAWRRRR